MTVDWVALVMVVSDVRVDAVVVVTVEVVVDDEPSWQSSSSLPDICASTTWFNRAALRAHSFGAVKKPKLHRTCTAGGAGPDPGSVLPTYCGNNPLFSAAIISSFNAMLVLLHSSASTCIPSSSVTLPDFKHPIAGVLPPFPHVRSAPEIALACFPQSPTLNPRRELAPSAETHSIAGNGATVRVDVDDTVLDDIVVRVVLVADVVVVLVLRVLLVVVSVVLVAVVLVNVLVVVVIVAVVSVVCVAVVRVALVVLNTSQLFTRP